MQSTLRSLRGEKISVDEGGAGDAGADKPHLAADWLLPASRQHAQRRHPLEPGITPDCPLLDSLTSALNKVYQRKGVNISLDISPEITFVGEQNDFMEVMGNVLDNACKYWPGVREVSVRQTTDSHLHILVEDDGPGSRRASAGPFFDRGQRADTLRPGQG